MQQKVLVIENSQVSLNLMEKLVHKANLTPIGARSLTEAQYKFSHATPEDYLCAVVGYQLPDAPRGEAIDFTTSAFLPTIVVTDEISNDVRDAVLARDVVDYVPKENNQVYDYIARLLARLDKNRQIGVLVVHGRRGPRAYMASLLYRHNFSVFQVGSAKDAMAALAQRPNIQLVLTDSALPDESGTRFIANLRKLFSKEQLAIIGIADGNSAALSAHFLKSGANDFLRLPFCHEEFLCRIMQNVELMENVESIRNAANTDYLTGLSNRRHFFYTLSMGYQTLPTPHALALLDLDFFKNVNDTHGHDAGDAVLKAVAELLTHHFNDELVARFGGEEFCVYLPQTDADTAMERMEAFRRQVAALKVDVDEGSPLTVTVSIGMTFQPADNVEALLSAADRLLYQAKAEGRNQVCSDS